MRTSVILFAEAILLFSGCSGKKPGPEAKTILLIRGDVLCSSRENKGFVPAREGQFLSNKDILTVADEAACEVAVGRDTLFIGGGSRVNISSKVTGKMVLMKVVLASGRIFFMDDERDPVPRQMLLLSKEAQGTTAKACFSIEKDNSATRFTVLSGSVKVKSRKAEGGLTVYAGQSAEIPAETGVPVVQPISDGEELHRHNASWVL